MSENSGFSTGVFERESGNDEISARTFYLALSLAVVWGLGLSALVAHRAILAEYHPGWMGMIGFGLALPILGIFLAVQSDNAIVSFIGYNLIVIPLGLILGPAVNHYSANAVRNAAVLTGGITCFMGVVAVARPNVFSKLGGPLFLALIGLLIVRVLQIFIPSMASLTFIDYIAAGIFTLYIGFDMYRAQTVVKTFDNAVDIAIDLYLDIVNLFMNILRILGNKD